MAYVTENFNTLVPQMGLGADADGVVTTAPQVFTLVDYDLAIAAIEGDADYIIDAKAKGAREGDLVLVSASDGPVLKKITAVALDGSATVE